MEILAGTPAVLSPDVMTGLARYRHKVFIEKLGWELSSEDGQEYDQFDHSDTTYLIARNENGSVVGTARLLPTSRPYLLGEVFPDLIGNVPLPCSEDIWELSRFAAVDFESKKTGHMSQFSSPVAIGLLRAVLKLAAENGVSRLIMISHLGVERLLHRAGFVAHRVAPPSIVDGHPLLACWIEVTDEYKTARPMVLN